MFVYIDIANDGTELILAGGVTNTSKYLDDVYSFDVQKSVWTKLPNAPRAAQAPVCAAMSGQFIYWGGLNGPVTTINQEGPAVLNLTSKTWGTSYTSLGVAPSPSSADRSHLGLSNVGLAWVTMISIAVSTLIL
jgi:hypothetical protein